MGPRAGVEIFMDNLDKRKFLSLLDIEARSYRPPVRSPVSTPAVLSESKVLLNQIPVFI